MQIDWKKVGIGALFIGIFALGFIIAYLILKTSNIFDKNKVVNPTPNTFAESSPKPIEETVKQKGVYNILLLGHGGAGHDGGLLTDSIIVANVNTNSKKISLISIPRDLWVNGNKKINSAGITGFQNSIPVVSSVTGLSINYFVSVDFGGFAKIIDNLGGIIVQVPETVDDPFYPIAGQENNVCGKSEDEIQALKAKYSGYNLETQFTCRYEQLHFDKGEAKLDGTTALKFARSRHGDSDFGRSLRQFAVLAGIGNKLISFQMANKFDEIVNTIIQIVKTDLDAGTIKSLIQVLGDPKSYSVKQIQLSTDNVLSNGTSSDGQFILTPKSGNFNFSEIQNYIKTNLN